MVLESHMQLSVAEPDFQEKKISQKYWENGSKMDQKQFFESFLNLLKNFVVNLY